MLPSIRTWNHHVAQFSAFWYRCYVFILADRTFGSDDDNSFFPGSDHLSSESRVVGLCKRKPDWLEVHRYLLIILLVPITFCGVVSSRVPRLLPR